MNTGVIQKPKCCSMQGMKHKPDSKRPVDKSSAAKRQQQRGRVSFDKI